MVGRILKYVILLALAGCIAAGAVSCGSNDENKGGTSSAATSTKTEKKSSTRTRDKTSTSRTSTSNDNDGSLPDADQIKGELLGETITDPHLGEWLFEDLDEFVEFDIVDSQTSTDPDGFDNVEFVIDVKLMDINDGREYNGQLNVTYERRAEDMPWRLIGVTGEYRSAGSSV